MLVKVIDIKGKEYWLNPVYVKAVTAKPGKGVTEIHCSSFGSWSTSTIKVRGSAEEVAAALSEAMPGAVPYGVLMGEEDEQRRRQQAAAAAAAG